MTTVKKWALTCYLQNRSCRKVGSIGLGEVNVQPALKSEQGAEAELKDIRR